MKILSWNVQGLGNPRTVRALAHVVRQNCPSLVFVMESRLHKKEVDGLRRRFGNFNIFSVDAVGRSGGLLLLWSKDVAVEILGFSDHCIHFGVGDGSGELVWRGTGVYGWPETKNKFRTWNLIRDLKEREDLPWVCFGDFNETMFSTEKEGGRETPYRLQGAFRDCLSDCDLFDMGYRGADYTWCNGRKGSQAIRERLDRFVRTVDWDIMFPHSIVTHLACLCSDHSPLLLDTAGVHRSGCRPFRFESFWVKEEESFQIVEEAWGEGRRGGGGSVSDCLDRCAAKLKRWSRISIGSIGGSVKQLEEKLGELQKKPGSAVVDEEIGRISQQLIELQKKEEEMWKQRSRVLWLREGDRNSKFFHGKASARRRANSIKRLQNEAGQWCDKEEEIEEIVTSYYSSLFTSSDPVCSDHVRGSIDARISDEEASLLLLPYTEDEVKAALDQMHPLKAPGPDGMPALFFTTYWDVVGKDVTDLVLSILRGNAFPENLNHTFITLIPKVNSPSSMKDLRPISLCNVVYKLVSKVVANRLKPVLNSIISPTQCAFVPGRLIHDNALIAFEVFHSMRTKCHGRQKGFCALKLDMSKAYDRVEWSFVETVLSTMGLPSVFVNLVMRCITSTSFSFLINGVPKGFVKPSRGLRQGDPISPYLFLVCAEVLSSLIRKAEADRVLHGFSIAEGGPIISHLFFADDSLLFFKASRSECLTVKQILSDYERASGQCVNFDKSEMSFSAKLGDNIKVELRGLLGVKAVTALPNYLGLPTMIGRSKKAVFGFLLGRLLKRIDGWSEKYLSRAGKEILIKAVAQEVPQYVMSCFLVPVTICDELQSMMAAFWWGDVGSKRSIHWHRWDKLCTPKEDGGLGFRHLVSFNHALLAKQVWRLIDRPNSLCSRVFSSKYLQDEGLFDVIGHAQDSYVWRSLLSVRKILLSSGIWRVGRGDRIRILQDRWVPGIPCLRPLVCKNATPSVFVSCLIDDAGHSWDMDRVNHCFHEDVADGIQRIPLRGGGQSDNLFWADSRTGGYEVKLGYRCALEINGVRAETASSSHGPDSMWKKMWKLYLPPKIIHFLWAYCHNSLPCPDNLARRHIPADNRCCLCGFYGSTLLHITRDCVVTKMRWKAAGFGLKVYRIGGGSGMEWLTAVQASLNREDFRLFCTYLWMIWFDHNRVRHGERMLSDEVFFNSAKNAIGAPQVKSFRSGQNDEQERIWKKLRAGYIKLNCDSSFLDNGMRCAAGFVARDENGEVMMSGACPTGRCWSVVQAELLAILNGISTARECGFRSLEVVSDCKYAITAIVEGRDLSYTDVIAKTIRNEAASFLHCSFAYEGRECNREAHELAQWGVTLTSPQILIEELPSFILPCNQLNSY